MVNVFGPTQWRIGALALLCASGGCNLVPKYERPAAPVAAQFPGAASNGTGSPAAGIAWSDFIKEERLKQLITLALTNNRDLRVAALNVEQSRAQYRITRSASYPGVDADGGLTKQHAIGATTAQWSANVGLSAYELDFFGRLRSLNQQALETYLAGEEAKRSTQISLVAEVATQYFTWREAGEQLQLAHQTLEAVEESYRLNRASFDAGEANELDVRTAEGEVQTAKFNVLSYERQLAQAQNALVLLVGQPLPPELPERKSLDGGNLLSDIPAGLPSDLIERRPDILQTENMLKAANANIGAARAAFFPSITLTGSIGVASTQLSDLFGSGAGAWTFSPQITLPIFNAGKTRAQLSYAELSERIEVANYEKAIQTAFKETADALAANSSYLDQIDVEATAIAAQQRRLELATLRYRQGEDSYLNVLSAQRDLYSAEQGLLQARFNKLSSQISLYKALGGGWQ
jgi:multidrug efflux system outer membrane protein